MGDIVKIGEVTGKITEVTMMVTRLWRVSRRWGRNGSVYLIASLSLWASRKFTPESLLVNGMVLGMVVPAI